MLGKRHELKYMVSKMDYLVMVRRLDKLLRRDNHCKGKGYTITSLYFDDLNNRAYKEKINGEAIRHKYRIRYYNDNLDFIKLERKSKINQMTMKIAKPLEREEVIKIYNEDSRFLLNKEGYLYHDFYRQLNHRLIQPKVIIKYDREAFTHPLGDLRITFDQNVKTANTQTVIFDDDIHYISALEPNQVIVEVKFNGVLPDYIRNLIQTGNVMQASASKYIFSRKYNNYV
ncbi:polyphosphate polymerase domain-containing protein [Vallitalea okinawensis]|uniref:polyphosphate polymerase domain-containing protein n=1 Tax=Vallitalea okinawensis TaxID=2078660 RepID=UPI000CFD758C|nr:polyphosphate polymerase domain-containing protein [Vallitalea okinawensis]